MGRKLNLEHLSEEECEKILQVIQRDFELRQKEKERLGKIEEELHDEDTKRTILAKKKDFNENCCMRCFSRFIFVFNQKVQCYRCDYFICKNCADYSEKDKKYYCQVCERQSDLQHQACGWFYTNVKRKFKRFGSAKVVRSLYKRKRSPESENDSGYDPSLHSNSLPVGKRSRPSIEGFFASIPKEFHEDILSSSLEAENRYPCDDNGNHSNLAYKNERNSLSQLPGTEDFHAYSDKEVDRFKRHLNGIVDDLHTLLENQVSSADHASTAEDEKQRQRLLDNHRVHITSSLRNLIQSLHLVIDSQNLPEPLHSPSARHHYVKQILADEIEQYVGHAIDLGDDVTSEYFSEDGSTTDMPSPRPYEDALASAIIHKIVQDHHNTEAQRHVDEEKIVRNELTSLSNHCTILQMNDNLTESETDDPHSSTQTSINIDSELDMSESFDARYDRKHVSGDVIFASRIDSEIDVSAGARDKYGSSDTLKSEDMDLDDLVKLNTEENWRRKSDSSADVTLVVTDPEGESHAVPRLRKGAVSQLSDADPIDEEARIRSSLVREMVSPDILDEDEEQQSLLAFARSHRPALPDFSEDESGRSEVDLDDLSAGMVPSDHEESDIDDEDTCKSLDSEIMFGEPWTVQSPRPLFKERSFISPYDNIGQKKVGKDSTGPVLMFMPKAEGIQSPRIGEQEVEDLSDLSENEDRSDDDDLFPRSDEEVEDGELNEQINKLANSVHLGSSDETLSGNASEVDATDGGMRRRRQVTAVTTAKVKAEPGRKTPVDEHGRPVPYSMTPRKSVDLNSEDFSKLVAVEISKKLEAMGDSSDEELDDAEDADPKFLQRPRSQVVPLGDTAKFSCQVAGTQPLDVYWYRDMAELQPIEDNEHCEITARDNGRFLLEIFNVAPADRGQYLCIAVNDEGQTHRSMKLRLTENTCEKQGPEFLKGIQDVEVVEGRTVKFRCKIRGYPQPRVLWYKDGKRITTSDNYFTERIGNRDYMLTIHCVSLEDDAEYVVVARNASGEARSTAQLLVEASGDMNDNELEDSRPLPSSVASHNESLYPETEELLRIAEQVHAARTRVTGTAENVLQSADQVTCLLEMEQYRWLLESSPAIVFSWKMLDTIHKHLDEMDRTLNNLEDEVQVTSIDDVMFDSDDNLNNNPIYDCLSPGTRKAIIHEHDEIKYAAGNVRSVTTTAIEVLTSTEEYMKERLAAQNNEPAQRNTTSDEAAKVSGVKRKSIEHIIPKITEPEEQEEELNLTFTEFEKLYKNGLITREQMRKGKMKQRKLQQLRKALEELEDESEDTFDAHDLSPEGGGAAIDCGLKRVDSKRYRRDYVINRSPSAQKKRWEVTEPSQEVARPAEVVKSTPAGMREQVVLDETQDEVSTTQRIEGVTSDVTSDCWSDENHNPPGDTGDNDNEENIYLTASKVYTLEERIRQLEGQIDNVEDETSPDTWDHLEDEVARAVAQVAHTEQQVDEIEASVETLKRMRDSSAESDASERSYEAAGAVNVSPRHSMDRELVLRGSSTEEDIPESRAEYDDELSMPSVKNLRSMFNKDHVTEAGVKRVYSLTGRDLPRTVREQLRRQTPSGAPNTNIRGEVKQRGGLMELFDDSDLHVKDEPLPIVQSEVPPRSSTPLHDDSWHRPITEEARTKAYLDQSSIHHSPEDQLTQKHSPLRDSPQPIKASRSHTATTQQQPGKSSATKSDSTSLTSGSSVNKAQRTVTNEELLLGATAAPAPRSILRRTSSFGGTDEKKEEVPKKNRRSAIMARAAFWDHRILQGQLSDEAVDQEYPDLPNETFKRFSDLDHSTDEEKFGRVLDE